MSTQNHERLSVRITGRVQGVGFRHFARTQAREHGVHGWVRNEEDGSVRLVAEGPRRDLEKLLDDVRQGPRAARIEDVSSDWSEAQGEFDSFGVRH